MKKIFDLTKDDILIIGNSEFRFAREFYTQVRSGSFKCREFTHCPPIIGTQLFTINFELKSHGDNTYSL